MATDAPPQSAGVCGRNGTFSVSATRKDERAVTPATASVDRDDDQDDRGGRFEVVEKTIPQLQAALAAHEVYSKGGRTYTLDGFSAEFPEWHFNVRGSNTEPMLRLNLEATTQKLMEEKRDEVLAFIRS